MHDGLGEKSLRELNGQLDEQRSIHPYIASCTRRGKLLHFSGPRKPWLVLDDDTKEEGSTPMCARPTRLKLKSWTWSLFVQLACGGFTFVRCADIWSVFFPAETLCG